MCEIVIGIIIKKTRFKFRKGALVNPEEYLNAFSEHETIINHGIHSKTTKIERFQSYAIICLAFQIEFIKAHLRQAFTVRKCINPQSAKMISGSVQKRKECRIYPDQ